MNFGVFFGYDIFISYSRRDCLEYALALVAKLESLEGHHYTCFIDQEELPPGISLNTNIVKAIRKSRVLVVLLTAKSIRSQYVSFEIAEFAKNNRPIIPINVDGLPDQQISQYFESFHLNQIVWINEGEEGLVQRSPSEVVIKGIVNRFKYIRRRQIANYSITFFFLIVLGLFASALFAVKLRSDARENAILFENRIAETSKNIKMKQDSLVAFNNLTQKFEFQLKYSEKILSSQQDSLLQLSIRIGETNGRLFDTENRLATSQASLLSTNTALSSTLDSLNILNALKGDLEKNLSILDKRYVSLMDSTIKISKNVTFAQEQAKKTITSLTKMGFLKKAINANKYTTNVEHCYDFRADLMDSSLVIGDENAAIKLITFIDLQDPFTIRILATLSELSERSPVPFKVVLRHAPLPFHRDARDLAKAVIAARKQNFMNETLALISSLYRTSSLGSPSTREASTKDLVGKFIAKQGGNVEKFNEDYEQTQTEEIIANDQLVWGKCFRSVPVVVIEGVGAITGALPIETFQEALDNNFELSVLNYLNSIINTK